VSRVISPAALERDARRWRRDHGAVDVTPHAAEDCPRAIQPDGSCDLDAPCYFVGCRWHLHGDVLETGALRVYHPALEPDQLSEHCALTVAYRGSHGFDVIGYLMGISREQANEIFNAAAPKYRAGMLAAVADAERAEPGCADDLALDRRRPAHFDPRLEDDMDRTIPEGFLPIGETMEVVVGAHREIVRTSGEHIMRRYKLPRLAERLYMMLIADAACRRCGLAELTAAYQGATGCATGKDKITAALADLETAGLVRCDWRAWGEKRKLRGVSLVSSLKSAASYPVGVQTDAPAEGDPDFLRASDERETVDTE